MNTLIRSLAECCRAHLLEGKWLLAPSRRVGFQWLDRLALDGLPVVNLHVRTLKSAAFELACPLLADRGLSTLSEEMAPFLVDTLFSRLAGRGSGYLLGQPPGEGLYRKVFGAIRDLRLAGLSRADLSGGSPGDPAKARDLSLLLDEYARELESRRLVDYAGLLDLARERLISSPESLGPETLLLLPGEPELTVRERDLLGLIPPGRLIRLEVDSPSRGVSVPAALARVFAPQDNASSSRVPSVGIFRAVGEPNEVREALRRVLENGWRLDEVELLHTDPEIYVPLVFELGRSLPEMRRGSPLGVPFTFAEGVPVRLSRPGRALVAWLEWISRDFPQNALAAILHDGLLEVADAQEDYGELAALLRLAPIGVGRDRYLPGLDRLVRSLERRPASLGGEDDEDRESSPDRERDSRRLGLARTLRTFVRRLVELSPEPGAPAKELIERAARFLNESVRSVNELDNFARESLLEHIREIGEWVGETSGLDTVSCLAGLVDSLRVGGSGPAPGCIHVAGLHSGGHSGRPVTFILGLDDSRFPGAGLQDPVLLDAERLRLSPGLPTAASRLERGVSEFVDLLARIGGQVFTGFSCRSILDNREMFPSPILLHVYRALSGDFSADQALMLERLPAAVSFAPRNSESCLDIAEWWMHALCAGPSRAAHRALVEREFPHLGQGRRAVEARLSGRLTGYDGWVPEAGRDLDPTAGHGRVMSASAFELLGRCPLAFFYRYGLGIDPPREHSADLEIWLENMDAGSLLHSVFHDFIHTLRGGGRVPENTPEQSELLSGILADWIGRYRQEHPPASESAFHRRRRMLERTAAVFLSEEAVHCRTSTPVYLEWAVGMEPEQGGEGGCFPAGRIELADGRSVRVQGRIDRVDRTAGGNFAVWDYKTGSSGRYSLSNPFRQGRVMQHWLYLRLAGETLSREHDPDSRVESFGYFFPGPAERGRRLWWKSDNLDAGEEILALLCEIVSAGAFIATNEGDRENQPDCRFCDFQAACRDLHETVVASSDKLDNIENRELEAFRQLRGMPKK